MGSFSSFHVRGKAGVDQVLTPRKQLAVRQRAVDYTERHFLLARVAGSKPKYAKRAGRYKE